jgi:hypothetical protein
MMMGFGFLFMLLALALPVVLIAALMIWLMKMGGQKNIFTPPAPTHSGSAAPERSCSHCGTHLQSDWSHCPKCGAPAG